MKNRDSFPALTDLLGVFRGSFTQNFRQIRENGSREVKNVILQSETYNTLKICILCIYQEAH